MSSKKPIKHMTTYSDSKVTSSSANDPKHTDIISMNSEEVRFPASSAVSIVPVVLSQFNIQVYIEVPILLPKPAFKIQSLSKSVFIKSCRLMVNEQKLNIKGYINEEIKYISIDNLNYQSIEGHSERIRYSIPFDYDTRITFLKKPIISTDYSYLEISLINDSSESKNNKLFYSVDNWKINEAIYHDNIMPLKSTFGRKYTFSKIRKKILLNIELLLLQNQNLFLSPITFMQED